MDTPNPFAQRFRHVELLIGLAMLLPLASCHSLRQGAASWPRAESLQQVSVVAFGACADQDQEQPVWETILEAQPDLFLFMGDNIYAGEVETAEELQAAYGKLASKPGFADLRRQVPILAIWDDHDFGLNDGGRLNPRRDLYQGALLDFFAEPANSARRSRPGLYDAKILGPEGRRVQVILLDTRYFRDPLQRRPGGESPEHGRYVPLDEPGSTMLGEAQWQWLESQLQQPAELRLLVSSIQILAMDHGWERWGNLPHERRRLLQLIRDTGAEGVVLLSGDRHLGEIALLPGDDPEGVGYPLVEVTTGGLTHATGLPFEPNRFRVETEDAFREPNFGLLRVDWQGAAPSLTLEIRTLGGAAAITHRVPLADLQGRG